MSEIRMRNEWNERNVNEMLKGSNEMAMKWKWWANEKETIMKRMRWGWSENEMRSFCDQNGIHKMSNKWEWNGRNVSENKEIREMRMQCMRWE